MSQATFEYDNGSKIIIDEDTERAVLLPPGLVGEIVACGVWELLEALEWTQAARRLGLTIEESIERWELQNGEAQ